MLQLDKLLREIRTLDSLNKSKPTHSFSQTLSKVRSDLQLLLIEQYDKHLKALKLLYYSFGNKAWKLLANHLEARKTQIKIAYWLDPHAKRKIFNPKEIADSFALYYSSLYSVKTDPHTPQTLDNHIDSFLATLQLPTLTSSQLQALKPITLHEFAKAIQSLLIGKSMGPNGLLNAYYK